MSNLRQQAFLPVGNDLPTADNQKKKVFSLQQYVCCVFVLFIKATVAQFFVVRRVLLYNVYYVCTLYVKHYNSQ